MPHNAALSGRRRVFHPGRVERRPPSALVVLSQLQIKALAVHPSGNVADAGPGIEPRSQSMERRMARGHRASGEANCGSEELAALVEHANWIT